MAKKRKAKEIREEEKLKRLKAISKKLEDKKTKTIIDESVKPDVSQEELMENSRIISERKFVKKESFEVDRDIVKAEKSYLQREIENIKDPEIKEMPDFLTDPEKSEERKAVMNKIKTLLKHRFSLITIADILECNDYDRLDEIIERKDKIYHLVEKYSGSENQKPIKLFSGLKKVVGDENSRMYAEQEERMKAAINHIYEGKYFNNEENPEVLVEDIIAKIIDHPDFSFACQVEAEFMSYEMDRASKIITDLGLRAETVALIDELRVISLEADQRAHSYKVVNGLMSSYSKNIIKREDETEESR